MMQGTNNQGTFLQSNPSPELEHRSKKVSDKFSETLHVVSNEPSLAFFRIQEHVRKTLPQLVNRKHDVLDLQQQIQGACFDIDYATKAVASMDRSQYYFRSIQEQLKNSMFVKQQLKYEQARRQQERSRPSMYRAMMRTQTLDVTPTSEPQRRSADLSQVTANEPAVAEAGPAPGSDSPGRARSSSLSSHTWVSPASLMR